MRLVSLDDIRMAVGVKLKVLPKPAKRHVDMDAVYEKEIVDAVMSAIGDCLIVKPDMIGWSTSVRHGEFGISEPHPFPELLVSPKPPNR